MTRTTSEFGSQDWILIVDALAQQAGADIETDREQHAWELIETIAREQGLPPGELVRQSVY